MSDKTREAFAKWADLIYKVGVPLGLAALFFLKSSFATKPELEAVSERIAGLEKTLAVMVEQNRTNERQDDILKDHEIRLRFVEASRR